jgi:hypothetical protein
MERFLERFVPETRPRLPFPHPVHRQVLADGSQSRVKLAVDRKAARDPIAGSVCPSPSPWATGQTPPPTEQQLLAQIEFGSPPDDSDFQNAPGDPNSQDPHLYDFSCKYLLDQPYTVIWRQETRQQQFNTAVTTVKATIAAYAVPTANVGWVAHQYVTWVASPVKPTFAPEPLLSPSPGGNLQLLIFFQKGGGKIPQLGPPATPFACQDLEPLPTPWPSNAPAPVITGQCAAPF